MTDMSLILASGSRSRKRLLDQAGIDCEARPAALDEGAVRDRMLAEGADFPAIAGTLAREKAVQVSRACPGRDVLGGDQLLVCDGRLFGKARTLEEARENLKIFRGRTHYLVTSLSLVRDGRETWRLTETPEMTMRNFSDDFLEAYLEKSGPDILASVGCYFLEGRGVQLFSDIRGDYFTILGLPLLPLLARLRETGGVQK